MTKRYGFSFRISLTLLAGLTIAVGASVLAMVPRSACANATAYPALPVCDPNYYKTLKEKGWMEAMREVQVNNTVITKPASVLALSCFGGHVGQVSEGGGTFTDTGSSPSDVADAINSTIGSSLDQFISDNFTEPPIGAGTSFDAGGGYDGCDNLAKIWEEVKCATVDDKNGSDGFLLSSLDQFRMNAASGGSDVRGSTGTPTCDGNVPSDRFTAGMKSSTDLKDTTSVRGDTKYFSVARPNFCAYDPKEGGALGDGQICSKSSDTPKKCAEMPAIPTGVAVAYTGGKDNKDPWNNDTGTLYWTYRCLNPGCYFDVKANANSIKFGSGGKPPSGMKCSPKPY